MDCPVQEEAPLLLLGWFDQHVAPVEVPAKNRTGGEREIKLLLQDTKKKKKSSITPTPPRHQLHHGDSLHYRFDTECQISHLLWQLEVIRHQICCVHLKESFKAFVLVVIELLYDITWLCIV